MSERKLLSYILITAFLAVGIGFGSYYYFVGNPLERFRSDQRTYISAPTSIPTIVEPTPRERTVVESDLLKRRADVVGIVEVIDSRTLTIRGQGTNLPYLVSDGTKIYQVRTDVLSDPPLIEEIILEQVEVGVKVSVYLNSDQNIRAIFVVRSK